MREREGEPGENSSPAPWMPKRCNLGGILGDDMGLGKSVTTLALIASSAGGYGNKRRITLLVAPPSRKFCIVVTVSSKQLLINFHSFVTLGERSQNVRDNSCHCGE
jgi:SNF2 family DNA or RNA helicase